MSDDELIGGSVAMISLAGVQWDIPGTNEQALRDVSLSINSGEFVAIVGSSGCGKTTLLSILGLLGKPSTGTYLFDGHDTGKMSEAERDSVRASRIGFVFQNSYVVAESSVAENVAMGLRIRGVAPHVQKDMVEKAVASVGLTDKINKRAGDLSGGEKQRVALARAIVGQPDVLLADEPTGALDGDTSRRLVALLRSINASGTTIIVVTHDPVVGDQADRCLTMTDGILDADKPLDTVRVRERQPVPPGSTRRRFIMEFADAVLSALSRRTVLVMAAYALGIAALVSAMGLTSSTTGQIVTRLTEAGSDLIRVFYNEDQGSAAAAISNLKGVKSAFPVRTYDITYNKVTRLAAGSQRLDSGRIRLTTADYLYTHALVPVQGDGVLLDNNWRGMVAVLGAATAKSIGVADVGSGVTIWVNGSPITVVAILAPSQDILDDHTVFLAAGAEVLLTDPVDSMIEVHTDPGWAQPLSTAIPLAVSPSNPGSVSVSTVAEIAQLQKGINNDLAILLNVIGVVILILSTITAGVSMFLSVQHRAPHIALRRSFGATRPAIWRMYTYEGLIVGLSGGAFGSAVGVGAVWAITMAQGLPLFLGISTVATGIGAGVAAGILASFYPATHAARKDPAGILRSVT